MNEAAARCSSISRLESPDSVIVPQIIQVCNTEMMKHLANHPDDLFRVHPGTFEEIIANIFEDEGFKVQIISKWNQPDGGVDIIAVKKIYKDYDVRIAIQCKRHSKRNKVTAEPIRSLAGVLDKFKAPIGVLCTTIACIT